MTRERIYEVECDCSAAYEVLAIDTKFTGNPINYRLIHGTERTCTACKRKGLRYDLSEERRDFNANPDGSDA